MKLFTATQAKNNFGDLIEHVGNGPVGVTRNGSVVAVMLDIDRFRAIEDELAATDARRRLAGPESTARDVLHRFSRGEVAREAALSHLGLKHYGQLLDLLGETGLPLPQLPAGKIEEMTRVIHHVFDHA